MMRKKEYSKCCSKPISYKLFVAVGSTFMGGHENIPICALESLTGYSYQFSYLLVPITYRFHCI